MTTTTRPRPSMLTVRSSALSLFRCRSFGVRHRHGNLPAWGALGPLPVLPPTIRDEREQQAKDRESQAHPSGPRAEAYGGGDAGAQPDLPDQDVAGADPGAVHDGPVRRDDPRDPVRRRDHDPAAELDGPQPADGELPVDLRGVDEGGVAGLHGDQLGVVAQLRVEAV